MKDSSDKLKKITVLYVEDEDLIRVNVKICLDYIFNVVSANNGQEGIDKFKNNKIDLIITDINMPIKDGIEMLEEIKKISFDIPCIITSAYDKEMLSRVKYISKCLYISKPFDIKDLMSKSLSLLNFEKE